MKVNEMAGNLHPLQSAPIKINNNRGAALMPTRHDNANRSFGEIFNEQLEEGKKLLFSKHAAQRLNTREMALSDEQMQRVENGVMSAYAKGINDSLVLVDQVALVVNIASKTVITAMMRNGGENIFTNIDGAVIV
jgi:flagellar operon protein